MDDEIDFTKVGRTLWRRRGLVAATFALGLAAGVVWGILLGDPAVQVANAVIRPAGETGDLYSSASGLAQLLQAPSFQQAALRRAGLDAGAGRWSITAVPHGDQIVLLNVRHTGPLRFDLSRYARALVDEATRQGEESAAQRRRALYDALAQMSAAANRLMAAGGGVPAAVADAQRQTNIAKALAEAERDLSSALVDLRPPALIGDITSTQAAPRPVPRVVVAATLLGLVAGVGLAFLVEALRPAERVGYGTSAPLREAARPAGGAGE